MTDAQPSSGPFPPPVACPACGSGLLVTRLQCPNCRTEVSGAFTHPAYGAGPDAGQPTPPTRLVNLSEPFASLLELFIRVRGNVKDVERELGLSYPTVRARLDEAFMAAQPFFEVAPPPATPAASATAAAPISTEERAAILSALERGEITAAQATTRLRQSQGPSQPTRSTRND